MRRALAAVVTVVVTVGTFTMLEPATPALAHGSCTPNPYMIVVSIGGVAAGADYKNCDYTHYKIQGAVWLQYKKATSSAWLNDFYRSGTFCCNIKYIGGGGLLTQFDYYCFPDAKIQFRARIDYIQTISTTGNVAHRYTGTISSQIVSNPACPLGPVRTKPRS
jgi:hypothetical protein